MNDNKPRAMTTFLSMSSGCSVRSDEEFRSSTEILPNSNILTPLKDLQLGEKNARVNQIDENKKGHKFHESK